MRKSRYIILCSGITLLMISVITGCGIMANRFESARQAVTHMNIGWNLGNSLDCVDFPPEYTDEYELYWGNPMVTPELIKAVKAAGFSSIRVPITWNEHMDGNDIVNEEWMNRVTEVVDMVLAEDLYCIINVHHDTGANNRWLRADADGYDKMSRRFAVLWQQIANHFIDYDERLLFEGFNELSDHNSSTGYPDDSGKMADDITEAYRITNNLNQLFVDTVRATGGNNQQRNLICSTFYSSIYIDVLDQFKLPDDQTKGHLIAKVISYAPFDFTFRNNDLSVDQFDRQGYKMVDATFAVTAKYFTERKIPYIIAEFGAMNKENDAERAEFAAYFRKKAKQAGTALFWWDNGIAHEFQLIDRTANTVAHPEIIDALFKD